MYNYGLGDIAGKRAASAAKVLASKSAHVGSVPGNHMSDFHTRDEVHILTSRDWAQKDWTRYNCSNWESTEAVFACTQTVIRLGLLTVRRGWKRGSWGPTCFLVNH